MLPKVIGGLGRWDFSLPISVGGQASHKLYHPVHDLFVWVLLPRDGSILSLAGPLWAFWHPIRNQAGFAF